MYQRIIAALLSICLLLTSMPLQAIAQTLPETQQSQAAEPTAEASVPQSVAAGETMGTEETAEAVPETTVFAPTEGTEAPQPVTVPVTEPAVEQTQAEQTETEPSAAAAAAGVTDSGLAYSIHTLDDGSQTAEITGYTGTVTEITVPDTIGGVPVTRINSHTFQGNDRLTGVVFPDSVTEIADYAFRYCTDLTVAVWPGSYAEQYAMDNHMNYVLAGAGGAVEVTLDPQAYSGMQLLLTCGGLRRAQRVQEAQTYRFTALEEGAAAVLQVVNAYGEVVEEHEIPRVHAGIQLELTGGDTLGALTVALLDENGNAADDEAIVEWFDEKGEPYASGTALRGLRVGQVLLGKIQLSSQYGKRYHFPEDIRYTVEAGSHTHEIALKPIAASVISGTVRDDAGFAAGAAVVIAQTINGKYTLRTTAVTDKQGFFQMEVPAVEAQLTISAHGCMDYTQLLTGLEDRVELGTLTLEAVTGTLISIAATCTYRTRPGRTAQTQKLTALDDLSVTVYNRTQAEKVESVLIQGMILVLADHCAPGDVAEITLTSLTGEFQPVTGTVTVTQDNSGEWTAELVQSGSVLAEFSGAESDMVQLLLYGETGALIWTGSAGAEDREIETGLLPDGTYTAILMSKTSVLPYPNTLDGFAQLGLREQTDYVRQEAAVRAGGVTLCRYGVVPALEESRFCYTDPAATSFTTSKTALSAGQFFTLRASAAFLEQYREQITDVKWIFRLPESVEYYDGTLSLSGDSDISYAYSDGILEVPVDDPGGIVRFCAYATGEGEAACQAYLEFIREGKTVRQPVGTATVRIGMLDFSVTGMTYDPTVTIVGRAGSNAEIRIYDNNVLIGQVKASPNGGWDTKVELYATKTRSTNALQAVMQLPSGTQVRSKVHTVNYQYSPDPVKVKTVTMYGFLDKTVFDFQNPTKESFIYSTAYGTTYTFVIEFDCSDFSRLGDIKLEVRLTDGTSVMLDTVYDETQGGYVTSREFDMNALPVNVAVSYVCDEELVFSGQHIAELKQETADRQETVAQLNELREANGGRLFPALPMDEESIRDYPEDLIRLGEEYNEAVARYNSLEDELSALMDRVYGNIESTQTRLAAKGDYLDMNIVCQTIPAFAVADKLAEGYEAYQVGEDADNLLLIRTTVDEATGRFEQSVIDTTSNGAAASLESAAFYALDRDVIADMDLYKSGVEFSENFWMEEGAEDAFLQDMQMIESCVEKAKGTLDIIGEKVKQLQDTLDEYEKPVVYAPYVQSAAKAGSRSINWGGILSALDPTSISGRMLGAWRHMESSSKAKHYNELYKQTGLPAYKDAARAYSNDVLVNMFTTYGPIVVGGVLGGGLPGILGGAVVSLALLPVGDEHHETVERVEQNVQDVAWDYWTDQAPLSFYTGSDVQSKIDPSGYIYEAVPSNRLPGATVTCYEKVTKYDMYDEPYEEIQFWDAEKFDQVNPLITDEQGQYAWDVPVGWWQVKAEKAGYETTYSEWLPVPPPQLEVNLGLVSYAVPEIQDVFARQDVIEVEFSKYMRADTLNTDTVRVSAGGEGIPGTVEVQDGEASPTGENPLLARRICFVPDEPLAEGTSITVTVSGKALSYADVAADSGESMDAVVVSIPESLFVPESVSLPYQGAGTVSIQALPAEAAAGETVAIQAVSGLFLEVEEQTVTLDETGCALIHIRGKLPGETQLQVSMCGGRLEASTRVAIQMPGTETSSQGTLTLDQEYLALDKGESAVLTAQVQPEDLAGSLCWSVEKGSETIAAVDAAGRVTALNPGTAYVLASVMDGDTNLTARCRVDVAEKIILDGVQLETGKASAELYSTAYAELSVLLKLPQNYTAQSAAEQNAAPQKGSAAIESAWFADETMAKLFDLVPVDDRRLAVVPTEYAVSNPEEVKGICRGDITVRVDGEEYPAGELQLTVKKRVPKLKGSVAAFNSFYTGQTQQIQITGATVTSVCEDASKNSGKTTAIPQWLKLQGTNLTLTEAAPAKNVSGKVSILVYTREWRIPAALTLSVKCSSKAPGLKLSASGISVAADMAGSAGTALKLRPKNKKDTLEELNVIGITAPEGYRVENFQAEDGSFLLKVEEGFQPGKITLKVRFSDTDAQVPLNLTVKTASVTLKLSSGSITLNTAVKDSAVVAVFHDDMTVESKPAAMRVKMGSAKLTLTAKDTTLFAKDSRSRAEFFISTGDGGLNTIADVKIKDAKYRDVFEIMAYGGGNFAIGFRENTMDRSLSGKTVTVNLEVFLEGNRTQKANATVKLKLSINP